jgi:aminoglycoside 3-N-acetyltransferase
MDLFRNNDQIITDKDFEKALASLNLKGRTVFCYSRLFGFGRICGVDAVKRMIEVLIDAVSSEGTLIIPAYTFSAYSSEVFDPETTRSTVGVFGEVARNTPGFVRSVHPVYSHVAYGKHALSLCEKSSYSTCFGSDSFFAKFAELSSAYILVLGTTFSVITGAHYYDQLADAPGRFIKKFPASLSLQGEVKEIEFDSFVKDYDFYSDCTPCFAGLDALADALGVVRRIKFADDWIHGITEKDFSRLYLLCLKYGQRRLLTGTKAEFESYYQKNNFNLLKDSLAGELVDKIKAEFKN